MPPEWHYRRTWSKGEAPGTVLPVVLARGYVISRLLWGFSSVSYKYNLDHNPSLITRNSFFYGFGAVCSTVLEDIWGLSRAI